MTSEDRFWSHVAVGGGEECWEWKACLGRNGYGATRFNGRVKRAHRVAWVLTHGPIPEGLFVLHHCDNRRCVNPNHLYIGNVQDNSRDCVERNRTATGDRNGACLHPETRPRGEDHCRAKLTEDSVRELRRLMGSESQRALARRYGVTYQAVQRAQTRRTWKHLE